MSAAVAIEKIGSVTLVRFTRPERRNPLSRIVIERLHELVDEAFVANEQLIFTGSGEAFASGANLNEIAALKPSDAPEFAILGQSLMQKIAEFPNMTIAAINGSCFGGALDLALACRRRIASPNAKFCHPGAGLGIITGWGGTQRLPRLIGHANACEMFFTASPIDAKRALEIGLIDEIAEHPLESAIELSKML